MDTDKIKIKLKKVFVSDKFRTAMWTVGILALIFFIFQAGMIAGYRKASFGHDWGENYANNFGSPHKSIRMGGEKFGDFGNLPNAHGAIGKIIKVDLPTIVVFDGKDQTEKIILINDKTEIRKMRDIVFADSFKVDDHVVVIGNPNSSGQIEAKLIRFIPAPPEFNKNN